MKIRRAFIFLAIISLITIASFLYFKYSEAQEKDQETLIFNPTLGKWERVAEVPRIELDEIEPNPNEDGLHNRTIVRGFFNNFNLEANEVTLKMAMPFTGESQYKLATFKLAPEQKSYCSPSKITDQVTGKTYQTKDLGFIVKNGQAMNISQEKNISFDDLVKEADEDTYVFLQLTNAYQEDTTNYIQKMVVLGLCD
jgi:hypothetical protein